MSLVFWVAQRGFPRGTSGRGSLRWEWRRVELAHDTHSFLVEWETSALPRPWPRVSGVFCLMSPGKAETKGPPQGQWGEEGSTASLRTARLSVPGWAECQALRPSSLGVGVGSLFGRKPCLARWAGGGALVTLSLSSVHQDLWGGRADARREMLPGDGHRPGLRPAGEACRQAGL